MRIFLTISGLLLTVGCIFILAKEGFSWFGLGALLFSVGCSLIIIFEKQLDEWSSQSIQKSREAHTCKVKRDCFYFPRGYYFKYGFLKNRRDLPFEVITEIRTNTFPFTAVVEGREVIFLRGLKTKDLAPLKQKGKIPFTRPTDNWELICEEFLDTGYDESHQQRTLDVLYKNGIPPEEVAQIRKRLRVRMLIRTYAGWEWMYYGQQEVLNELWPLNQKKYWWTMDIALRGGEEVLEN
ncbi:MAG: hypothetical protein AAGI38_10510 [Bacteroidota bacterium]